MQRKSSVSITNLRRQVKQFRVYTELSDGELAGFAIDDPQAFTVLYDRYFKRVYYYLLDIVKNLADTEDLTSQTFLSAFASIGDLRNKECFGSWLFQIARSKANDLFRKTNRREEITVEFIEELDANLFNPSGFSKEDVLTVRQLVSRLSPEDAELLRLKFVAELTFNEMSKLTGYSVDKTKKKYYKIIRYLAIEMKV